MKNFNIKKILKTYKTNESAISMALGALVVFIVGILVVNYLKDRNTQKVLEQAARDQIETQLSGKEHVVVKGESLWKIAEATYGSGYKWTDIAKANKLTNYSLEIGQKLTLPELNNENVANVTKPNATKVQESGTAIAGDSYVVVHGDNLWNIAVRAYGDGYQWVKIAHENKLDNPGTIHAGNVLSIPR